MSLLRFIAWMNILLEVIYDGEGEGCATEEMANLDGGTTVKYTRQAFCDDGLFLAENNRELQVL